MEYNNDVNKGNLNIDINKNNVR